MVSRRDTSHDVPDSYVRTEGVQMRRRLALVLAIAATAFAGGSLAPATHHGALAPPAYAKSCSSGWTHAVLSWGHKCLRAGQFCKRSADREYHRYRYHCHRYDASAGRYRLTR